MMRSLVMSGVRVRVCALMMVMVLGLACLLGCSSAPPVGSQPLTPQQIAAGKAKAQDTLTLAQTGLDEAQAQADEQDRKAVNARAEAAALVAGDPRIEEWAKKAEKAEGLAANIRLAMIALRLGVRLAQSDFDRWDALSPAGP